MGGRQPWSALPCSRPSAHGKLLGLLLLHHGLGVVVQLQLRHGCWLRLGTAWLCVWATKEALGQGLKSESCAAKGRAGGSRPPHGALRPLPHACAARSSLSVSAILCSVYIALVRNEVRSSQLGLLLC